MPELPEVETVVRALRPDVVGRRVMSFTSTWENQLNMPASALADRITGQRIETLGRRGKYILFELQHDWLIVHLKMTGRLYVLAEPDDADRWVRATFPLDDGRTLFFSDSRKFGRIYLTSDQQEVTGDLGPEPLGDALTVESFRERIAPRSGVIKALLLNQTFIAGVGNIYADEALWRARIDPHRTADTLTSDEIDCLYESIRAVLHEGIAWEGASIGWYRKPDGSRGEAQDRFNAYIYKRGEEKTCARCGNPIVKTRIGQRGTHYCPTCQT
ncbi:MAG: DNA-formamidopyrimidine glycosylase [Chloroflexi bacterium]|nr:DNA-formamidopyrimidine glycosylase [Chloroflexota bacterium]